MKGKSSFLATLLILVAGVVLLICCDAIKSRGIVILGGIIFLVPSIINMVLYLSSRDDNGERRHSRTSLVMGWITSVAGVVLGLCMLVFQETFIKLLPFVFGVMVLFAALFHFYALAVGYRPVKFPGWMYFFPLLIAIMGTIVLFITPDNGGNDKWMMILTGLGLVLFSVGCFFESWFLRQYNRMMRDPSRFSQSKSGGLSAGSGNAVVRSSQVKGLDD